MQITIAFGASGMNLDERSPLDKHAFERNASAGQNVFAMSFRLQVGFVMRLRAEPTPLVIGGPGLRTVKGINKYVSRRFSSAIRRAGFGVAQLGSTGCRCYADTQRPVQTQGRRRKPQKSKPWG